MPRPNAPCPIKLSVGSILTVTQMCPTSKEHRIVNQEMLRVQNIIDGKNAERTELAQSFITQLTMDVMKCSAMMYVKTTHPYWPSAYFEIMSPRFMQPPSADGAAWLRWKAGSSKKLPYTCLEVRNSLGKCLPWTTIHEPSFHACDRTFPT